MILKTATPPDARAEHVLGFLTAADGRDFDAALEHFEDDAVVIARDVDGGRLLSLDDFRAMLVERKKTLDPCMPQAEHEVDALFAADDHVMVEGQVAGTPNRWFLSSVKLGPTGRIRRYSFLTWDVDDVTAERLRG